MYVLAARCRGFSLATADRWPNGNVSHEGGPMWVCGWRKRAGIDVAPRPQRMNASTGPRSRWVGAGCSTR
jgi:hypothetical protein